MFFKKIFSSALLLLIVFVFLTNMNYAQAVLKSIGKYKYAEFADKYYTYTDNKKGDLIDTKHIIVKIDEANDINKFDFKKAGLSELIKIKKCIIKNYYKLEITESSDPFSVAEQVQKSGLFKDVYFNAFHKVAAVPNDPIYSSQWNLSKIAVSDAWNLTAGSNSVIVAVIDVGFEYDHEDLAANCWSGIGQDFIENDGDPRSGTWDTHGTRVAGIIGASTNNQIGVAGIAGGWNGNGVKLMYLDAGDGYTIDVDAEAAAINYAAEHGAKVISMSFYGSNYSVVEDAINNAVNNYNVVCVASAGNYFYQDPTSIWYPAAYSNVIAVGATIENDSRKVRIDGSTEPEWGSCYGPELDVVAPGLHIATTDNSGYSGADGNYCDYFSGTSAAAPHVAALAALILSKNNNIAWQQVKGMICSNADKVAGMGGAPFTEEYGYGRINAYKALTLLRVPEVFSTINSAANVATSGQTIYVTGTQTLTSNTVIPSGVTLTLKSGSTINLNGYAISTINGTINAETGITINGLMAYFKTGSTLKGYSGSVQNAINTASFGQTVELLAKTYNDLALTISGKSNFKLIGKGADKTFLESEGSISVTSSTEVLLSDMFVYGPISNTNSTHTVTNNLVYGEACGIYDYNGTNTAITGILSTPGGAAFGISCYGGRGDVYGNNISGYDVAVYIANSNTSYNVGPNNNFCENYEDIAALYGGYAYAISNDYSRPLPATIAGNVSYDHGVNGVCTSLAKRSAKENGIALIEDSGSYYPDSLKAIDEEFNSLLTQNKDNEAGLKDILLPVISKYKKFVSGSNTAKDFSLGLQKVMHAYKTYNGKEEFYSYLTELESAAKHKAYSPVINKFNIWKYADAGDYAQAVATADAVIASGLDDMELLAGTLYEKGVILRDYLSDNEGAKISFEQLIKEYPSSPLKRFAEAQLNTTSANKGKADSAAADVKEIVNVFEAGNYPNPFNPTTVIRYSIPEGGNVSLKVYDILGREVAKLVNEFQEAGTHSVEFNGSALSSGIYFYELRSGNNVMIKKMLMMK